MLSRALILVTALAGVSLGAAGCGDDDPASPGNRAPSIASLSADASSVEPAGIATITCAASDPDQDELTYAWTASAGDIIGTGPTA